MPNPMLADLAAEVAALAASPEQLARRRLWADLHSLRAARPLVSYAMYTHVWERELAPEGAVVSPGGLERAIEVQLRARLWKARNIPDDEPALPTVWLGAPPLPGSGPLWGIDLPSRRSDAPGATKPIPPIGGRQDLPRLRPPRYRIDRAEADRLIAEAAELIGGALPVRVHHDEAHFGPFEWVVRMRGMDALLFDVVDEPALVHDLMEIATSGIVAYHRGREAAGDADPEAGLTIHMYHDELPAQPRLRHCWAYVHAQSAASLSPGMYEEFVQPYNARVAGLFGKVYYHGCEDLSRKARIIGRLPNLRLFHIGPWTPPEPVLAALGDRCAYEAHSHPTQVLFEEDFGAVRTDLARLATAMRGSRHVLKLCDIETVGGRGGRLAAWAVAAREAAEGAS
ncbi:MAG: hypothetical protein NT029_07990 [Armatimonadetes bacterium]|nr:hypothetical protein [Armatimonadota bacterium]